MTDSIWKTLSVIDCGEHTEEKGGFTYLAWTWAWSMVKENYPLADFEIMEDKTFTDGSVEVRMRVTIEDLSHTCWLPVLDFRNKAIQNPDAFAINTSRMRCLTKCLAFFGLGFYIYAGESFPAPSHDLQEKYDTMVSLVALTKEWELRKFMDENRDHTEELFNMAPQGKKTAFKSDVRKVYGLSNTSLKSTLSVLEDAVGNPDTNWNVTEVMGELGEIERYYVDNGMNEILAAQVKTKMENAE